MKIGVGSAWKSASLFVGVGGAWKAGTLSVGVSGAWKADADNAGGGGGTPLSATVSPASRSATRFGSGTLTTATVVVTAAGGTGPYTYLWTFLSGDSAVGVTAPASNETAFTGHVNDGDALHAVWTCTVTDSLGHTATVNATGVLVETH